MLRERASGGALGRRPSLVPGAIEPTTLIGARGAHAEGRDGPQCLLASRASLKFAPFRSARCRAEFSDRRANLLEISSVRIARNDLPMCLAPSRDVRRALLDVREHRLAASRRRYLGTLSWQAPLSGFQCFGAKPQTFASLRLAGRSPQVETGPVDLLGIIRRLWPVGPGRRLLRLLGG